MQLHLEGMTSACIYSCYSRVVLYLRPPYPSAVQDLSQFKYSENGRGVALNSQNVHAWTEMTINSTILNHIIQILQMMQCLQDMGI